MEKKSFKENYFHKRARNEKKRSLDSHYNIDMLLPRYFQDNTESSEASNESETELEDLVTWNQVHKIKKPLPLFLQPKLKMDRVVRKKTTKRLRTNIGTLGLTAKRPHTAIRTHSPRKNTRVYQTGNAVMPGITTVPGYFLDNTESSESSSESGTESSESSSESGTESSESSSESETEFEDLVTWNQVHKIKKPLPLVFQPKFKMNCDVRKKTKKRLRTNIGTLEGRTAKRQHTALRKHSPKKNIKMYLTGNAVMPGTTTAVIGERLDKYSDKENLGDHALSRWKQGRFLGAGTFGRVFEYIHTSRTYGFEVPRRAVKVVKIEPQYTVMSKEVKALRNEINILMNLKHERIVSVYGSEERDDHLYLIMEFMAGGSLSERIKINKFLFESESRRYTRQILEGVRYLHSKGMIHRDIKGSNVLLDGERNAKLADFGLSRIIQKIGSKTDLSSHCGTPHWMAPEIIRDQRYGRRADIWSVGCTVVEMLTGRPPLGKFEAVAAIFQIGSKPTVPTLPEDVSEDAKQFVQAALTWDPSKRPWSEELLNHNFVLDHSDW